MFRRIEGAGGDGGVEAYWLLADGTKIGYQAKFFTRTRDIDWTQIDDSVERALHVHPTLTTYVVALPCNLTDRRSPKSGKTGWELWDEHRASWTAKWLTPTGRHVDFVVWTESELLNKLTAPSAEGLRQYWFSDSEFSTAWFNEHVQLATASLDERYHPEDHVDVTTEALFRFIARDREAISELAGRLSSIRKVSIDTTTLKRYENQDLAPALNDLTAAYQALLSIETAFVTPLWQAWSSAGWVDLARKLQAAIKPVKSWAYAHQSSPDSNEGVKQDMSYIRSNLNKLDDATDNLLDVLNSRFMAAEHCRAAIIEGRAGSGKSHLLGHVAESRAAEGMPVILLLGHQLGEQPLWNQISQRLGLPNLSPDALLQALDTAAEAAHTRSLILVDAINEGPGARLWRAEAVEFFRRIQRYPHLACVVSCRSEYVPYVFPEELLRTIPRIEVRGFETPKEQINAARVYLDQRGIARPSAPWLAPEFVNPLFLRSTCLALSRERKKEFPKGLHGTKAIFSFYIQSVARNLGAGRDGSDELIRPCMGALREIALRMAASERDYVSHSDAIQISAKHFSAFPAPPNQTWLDVIQRNGLVRVDPDPTASPDDPFRATETVVRFSFQRLQDHLMAEALLEHVTDVRAALGTAGTLSFIHDGKHLQGEWQGLVEALSIQIPERFEEEFVDVLPGGFDQWWQTWSVQDAFMESIRWRSKTAFTDRTLNLFNQHNGWRTNQLSILIELTASPDHPWNADLLHANLKQRKLADRDAFWTTELNELSAEGTQPVGRLIDWCLVGQTTNVERAAQLLSATALCWFLTSSNRRIRDSATKALVSLFIHRADLFPELVTRFIGVDDIYVLERLFAAGYAAVCADPSASRLPTYATATYNAIFDRTDVPLSLLLRDYARGIVECSVAADQLPTYIDIDKCRPPYSATAARLNVTETALAQTVDKAGDKAIQRSCEGALGDFGIYEITPAVGHFSSIALKNSPPDSREALFDRFDEEVIQIDPRRIAAAEKLQSARLSHFVILRKALGDDTDNDSSEEQHEELEALETEFLKLLKPHEKRRYDKEAAWRLGDAMKKPPPDPPSIDVGKARRWVAKRAYALGWTKRRFPDDTGSHGNYSRDRPVVERIGKKYQWIALGELLCRLADNCWIKGSYGDDAKRYDNPLDLGFQRDVDPTVIPISDEQLSAQGKRESWLDNSNIALDEVDESELCGWPFLADPGAEMARYIRKTDPDGTSWLVLYEHQSKENRYEKNERAMEHGLRQQQFHFLMCVIIKKSDLPDVVRELTKRKNLDVMRWSPREFTDGPFLREIVWRDTWPQGQYLSDDSPIDNKAKIMWPVYRYHWESHLDASLPNGAEALLPSPWLSRALCITADRQDASLYRDNQAKTIFIGHEPRKGPTLALVEESKFSSFLTENDLQCLWLFVAERNVWPGGSNVDAAWRRSEGLCWFENGKPKTTHWKKDRANGTSRKALPD